MERFTKPFIDCAAPHCLGSKSRRNTRCGPALPATCICMRSYSLDTGSRTLSRATTTASGAPRAYTRQCSPAPALLSRKARHLSLRRHVSHVSLHRHGRANVTSFLFKSRCFICPHASTDNEAAQQPFLVADTLVEEFENDLAGTESLSVASKACQQLEKQPDW
jgi:hypothetical protein